MKQEQIHRVGYHRYQAIRGLGRQFQGLRASNNGTILVPLATKFITPIHLCNKLTKFISTYNPNVIKNYFKKLIYVSLNYILV